MRERRNNNTLPSPDGGGDKRLFAVSLWRLNESSTFCLSLVEVKQIGKKKYPEKT
jgi:hypothetical protein